MFTTKACQQIVKEHPRSQILNEVDKIKKYHFFRYRYGTSGFRGHNQTLESVMVRVGLLAVLRSFSQNCQAIGIMVTASHNAEEDNGVKIIDPSGEMMDSRWESLATQIANEPEDKILAFLQSKYEQNRDDEKSDENKDNENKDNENRTIPAVFIARDTRPHSLKFAQLVAKAATSINSKVVIKDFGEATTPHLHYVVRRANRDIGIDKISGDIYLKDVLTSYKKLVSLLQRKEEEEKAKDSKQLGTVIVDCANGVGGIPFKIAQEEISDLLEINLIHLPSAKLAVNFECGAEHVHKQRSLPIGLIGKENEVKNQRLASLDGDCDRLMYYYLDGDDGNKLCVCDGDKQICLLFEFMKPYINKCGVDLTVGVVQTGYANGASRHYIDNKLGIKSIITATGVKHLHHEAKNYDISVYFEANGHGTILVSDGAVAKLRSKLDDGVGEEEKKAIEILILIHLVSNQAIGDALADALLVEAALYDLNWNMKKWSSIYVDRPSCLTKLRVKDRTVFITANAEQLCVEPKGVQDQIDAICAKYQDSRSFVRPSGTEDCVRIYAEATTQSDADEINLLVQRAIYDIAGGVGQRP